MPEGRIQKEYYSQLALFYLLTAPMYPMAIAYTMYLAGLASTTTGEAILAAITALEISLPLLTRRRIHTYIALAGLPVIPATLYMLLAAPPPAIASALLAAATQIYIAYHTLIGDLGKTHLVRATLLALASLVPAALTTAPQYYLAAIAPYLLAIPPFIYIGREASLIYLNVATFFYTLTIVYLIVYTPQNLASYLLDVCGGELGYFYLVSPMRITQLLHPPRSLLLQPGPR